jgi:hypothetical protein
MRPAALPLLFLLPFAGGAAHAAPGAGPALIVEARLVSGGLEVMVANPRPAAVPAVTPEIVYQHRTLRGAPTTIEPGDRHTWAVELPPPLRPGAAAAVVRIRAEGLSDAAAAPVIVALVATPGTAPAGVRVTFQAAPVTRAGRAEVRLANPGDAAVDGRVVFVLPDGLATDPETRPARVPPGGSASVTLGIENRGALPPATYAVYALFEYTEGGSQQTATAKGLVTVVPPAGSGWLPLVVGGLALLSAIALLAVALKRSAPRSPTARALVVLLAATLTPAARAAAPSHPIRLTYTEGDVSGVTDISDPATGQSLGLVEYSQTRRDDLLSVLRVARFRDGSSDEDFAEARAGGALEAIGGRSVIRDADGVVTAEVHIDVAGGRIHGSWGRGGDRRQLDEAIALPPRTYWGPLIFIVLKEFAANADDGRVTFRTVALTPRPRVFDLEIVQGERASLERAGIRVAAVHYSLSPTVHWLVDPVIRRFLPETSFWMLSGAPPLLVRFEGPRNYARQPVRIQ